MSRKPEKILVNCPVCGSGSSSLFLKAKIEGLHPNALYGSGVEIRNCQDMVRCQQCSHVYENPRFDQVDIEAGYALASADRHDTMFENKVKTFKRALKKCHLADGAKRNLLDIGCAGGAFLEAANQLGWESFGVEISRELAVLGQARGLKIYSGRLQDMPRGKTYALVTLWDVLEHVVDPREILDECYQLLDDGGTLIINLPDEGSLLGRMVGNKSWWIMSVHLSYFNQKSLTYLCSKSGFRLKSKHPYIQKYSLEYLINIACNLRVPLASLAAKFLPRIVKKLPVPFYAGQTTFIFRKS